MSIKISRNKNYEKTSTAKSMSRTNVCTMYIYIYTPSFGLNSVMYLTVLVLYGVSYMNVYSQSRSVEPQTGVSTGFCSGGGARYRARIFCPPLSSAQGGATGAQGGAKVQKRILKSKIFSPLVVN